ncbi:MAG: fumarylacetoacetate hydrolase family protein [Alphaproteobacteria bacterium]|nr:fumarylacetoacetate hydrolase family protein [Alphaproteobacteria bacterium SS10]MBV6634249.1 fumarylacetoacetate hydrolase family protein [Alphaproteobacteria bacterium SS10]
MTNQFVFDPPATVAVPVAGSAAQFPIRRIFCVGRNYSDHVREMGGDPSDTPPVFFTKPADAVVRVDDKGTTGVAYPPGTDSLHHEVELVVALKSGGSHIPEADALSHVYGYAVGVDMTRRDIQKRAAEAGQPWDMAKGFDQSAPLGPIQPMPGQDMPKGGITLSVDGELRQSSDLDHMIWKLPPIISRLSALIHLEPGDLIYTGTPDGVGPVTRGQTVKAAIDGLPPISFDIT